MKYQQTATICRVIFYIAFTKRLYFKIKKKNPAKINSTYLAHDLFGNNI